MKSDIYKIEEFDAYRAEGFYQLPILKKENYIPKDIILFNEAMSYRGDRSKVGVHFYLDDYQFERLWSKPYFYIDILRQFDCAFSPDFSLYTDMPKALMIYNVYRSHLLGQLMRDMGIKVIPTLQWADKASWDFCFDGIEPGGVVSVSTLGVRKNAESLEIWKDGMKEAMKRLQPSSILWYGAKIDDYIPPCDVVYFKNHVIDRLKKVSENGRKRSK